MHKSIPAYTEIGWSTERSLDGRLVVHNSQVVVVDLSKHRGMTIEEPRRRENELVRFEQEWFNRSQFAYWQPIVNWMDWSGATIKQLLEYKWFVNFVPNT